MWFLHFLCNIAAHLECLDGCMGCQKNSLDPRNPTILVHPIFQIRRVRKSLKIRKRAKEKAEHLEECMGYQQNSLDLGIPAMPINPIFRIRKGRKSLNNLEKGQGKKWFSHYLLFIAEEACKSRKTGEKGLSAFSNMILNARYGMNN